MSTALPQVSGWNQSQSGINIEKHHLIVKDSIVVSGHNELIVKSWSVVHGARAYVEYASG